MNRSKLLRRKEAAAFLEADCGVTVAPATLAKYITVGGGPDYQKFGKIPLYSEDDLRSWAQGKLGPKASSSTELRALRERAHAPA